MGHALESKTGAGQRVKDTFQIDVGRFIIYHSSSVKLYSPGKENSTEFTSKKHLNIDSVPNSAKNLTIELIEGRDFPYRKLGFVN